LIPCGTPRQPISIKYTERLAVADLVDEIKAGIGEMPTYGYRRVWAVLRRAATTNASIGS
jgi:hypothetical protein